MYRDGSNAALDLAPSAGPHQRVTQTASADQSLASRTPERPPGDGIGRADQSTLPTELSEAVRSGTRHPVDAGDKVSAVPAVRTAAGTAHASANDREIALATGETGPLRPRRARAALISGLVAAVVAAGGWYAEHWWTVGRFMVSTDDAYVGAYNTTLAAKVSGYIEAVRVEDNTTVGAGDIIASLDDGDYRLAVDAARDKVNTQQATIERIGQQIAAQEAGVVQAKAQLASAQAGATRAQLELDRQQSLAAREFASRQALEQAQANRDQGIAGVNSAQATVEAALANVEVLKGQQQEARRVLDELRTSLAKAERDLSFTVIRAPFRGVIGNRAVQAGDFVQPGQRLASLVPLDKVYVDANFKETQLARIRTGQPVAVSVDAVPGRNIEGRVLSVAPASGSVFSLLPPDNATGNFTKIVQRVPVRIEIPAEVADQGLLRPGMSVVVSVDTKADASERAVAPKGDLALRQAR